MSGGGGGSASRVMGGLGGAPVQRAMTPAPRATASLQHQMTLGMPARELSTPAVAGGQLLSSSGQAYTMAHMQPHGGGGSGGAKGGSGAHRGGGAAAPGLGGGHSGMARPPHGGGGGGGGGGSVFTRT